MVKYRTRKGEELDITIDSDLMDCGGYFGYESVFHDDGERYFAIADGIIDWEGKA